MAAENASFRRLSVDKADFSARLCLCKTALGIDEGRSWQIKPLLIDVYGFQVLSELKTGDFPCWSMRSAEDKGDGY